MTPVLRQCPFCYKRYRSVQRHVETGGCSELDYGWLQGQAVAHAREQLVSMGLGNLAPVLGISSYAAPGEAEEDEEDECESRPV